MTNDATRPRSRTGLVWAFIPIGAFVVQAVVLAVTMSLASGAGLEAVEPDYYERSLGWDEHAELVRNGRRLGWTLDIAVGDPAGPLEHRTVHARLTDARGVLVDGARINLEAFPHAAAGERLSVALEPGESGHSAETAMRRAGLWEFRARITRGTDSCLIVTSVEVAE